MASSNRMLLAVGLLSGLFQLAAAADSEKVQNNLHIAHAIIGSVTWVVFFPLGAVMMRVLKSPKTWMIHAGVQLGSIMLLTAVAGMGIRLAIDTDQVTEYHCVIGYVIYSMVWVQAAWGYLGHRRRKAQLRRTFVAYGHVWLGRTLITVGMIQGGLGLLLSDDASRGEYIAYGVIAGVFWVAFMSFSIWSDFKAPPKSKARVEREARQSQSEGDVSDDKSEKSDA